MIKDKDMRKVVRSARERGWLLTAGGKHAFLVHADAPGHRIPVASTPSDNKATDNVRRRMRRCEEHRCEHGAPYPPRIEA